MTASKDNFWKINNWPKLIWVIMYGILATTLKLLFGRGISRKFKLRTFTVGVLSNDFFKELARWLSSSTATTLFALWDKGLVRAPLPAPISITISLALI